MDLSQFGGSTLETKALERALKRQKDKLNHKPRARPLLSRAKPVRDDVEEPRVLHPAQISPVLTKPSPSTPPPAASSTITKSPSTDLGGGDTNDGIKLMRMPSKDATTTPAERSIVRENLKPLEVNVSPNSFNDAPSTHDDIFPDSPFDTTPLTGRSAFSEEDPTPNRRPVTASQTISEPLLDVHEVRKYFGYSALESFSHKVSYINKQKNMLVKCPPLDLASTTSSRTISSASRSMRSARRVSSSNVDTSRSKTSTLDNSITNTVKNSKRERRMSHMVRTHSKKYDQLKAPSPNDGGINHDTSFKSMNIDGGSIMSDISGILENTTEANGTSLHDRKELMLSQLLFAEQKSDTDDMDVEHQLIEDAKLEEVKSSPRATYIMGCLSENLNPRGSHIIRKKICNELHLEHYGMGDELIEHLAASLQYLPHVSYINIADNNLTDWGLVNVLSTIVSLQNLLILDMSHNKIGTDAADALALYLSGNPPLQRLVLCKTDIDDFEGEMFVKAIHRSSSLFELNLSMNELGNQEILNSVRPNTTTAPEELATLLAQRYCSVTDLNLAWNVIRLDSAVSLAQSLAINNSLTSLDLSYNCIGSEGGRVIGESLFQNRTLKKLLLADNNIDAASCFIICTAIEQNYSLTELCMDGNPVGETGAKSLMNIAAAIGSRLSLSAQKCNVQIRSKDKDWFDECEPCGNYSLDMTDSYARAVAFKLLTIAANHSCFGIKKCYYSENKDPKDKDKVQVYLHQRLINEKVAYMTDKEKKVLQNLYKLKDSAKDVNVLEQLFYEYDFNRSGTLEHFELKILFDDLGLDLADNQIENAMTFIDIDKSGTIDLPEFVHFMQKYREDVSDRIQDMCEGIVMCEVDPDGDDESVGSLRSLGEDRFIPPNSGFLHFEIADLFLKKKKYNILTEIDCNNIIEVASKIGHVTTMISYALHSAKIRFNEALKFFNVMFHDIGNKAEVLLILLPAMIYPLEARILVTRVTNEDPVEIEFVRQKLGNALRPIFGQPCGFYYMNLEKIQDRIALAKLFEYNIISSSDRKQKCNYLDSIDMMGDTSQTRNSSCFRNEVFNEDVFKVHPDTFSPIPKEGILEFDFVVHEPMTDDKQLISDVKLIQILVNTSLLSVESKDEMMKKMNQDERFLNKCLSANGKQIYFYGKDIAAEIGEASNLFYENLFDRNDYVLEGIKREEIKVDFEKLKRRLPMLARLVSMTNNQSFMVADDFPESKEKKELLDALEVAQSETTFEEKFKEFINRPLGEQQQKLLESNVVETITDKPSAHYDDISEICSKNITRTEVFARKGKPIGGKTPKAPAPVTRAESFGDVPKKSRQKSRKGETVTLPRIVVMKNNKQVVLPELIISKEDEEKKEKNAMDEFLENKDSIEASLAGTAGPTRARMFSSSNLIHGKPTMGVEYSDYQKRIQLQTKNRRRMRTIAQSSHVSMQAKAARLYSMLMDFLGIFWVRCRHVVCIVRLFLLGKADKAQYYGTYRVDLVVALFSKIVDVHNFDIILKELEPKEQGCLYCRLGWLNLFNPTRPERSYELNMEYWEERMVAKALIALAIVEEGDNISDADFRCGVNTDRMPGWIVTKPWTIESTMQRKGLLCLTYSSCNVDNKLIPDVSFRKSLLNMVLSCEKDMVPEGGLQSTVTTPKSRTQSPKPVKLEGIERMLEDSERWTTYFYADKNVNSKITKVTLKSQS